MSLGATFRRLADVIDELEADGVEVTDAVPRPTGPGDGFEIDLRIRLESGLSGGIATENTSDVDTSDEQTAEPTAERDAEDADPSGAAGGETDEPDGSTAADVAERTAPETATGPERIPCRHEECGETFETEHGMKIHHTKVHVSGGDVEETPPHRDPAALREAYEAHDSFTEMRDDLGTDVSAQTVRRQMMKHGIHEPGEDGSGGVSDREGASAEGSEGTPEADGGAAGDGRSGDGAERGENGDQLPADETATVSGVDVSLPGDLTLARFRTAVETADTVYEVQQRLGLGRDETTDLLERFDLLELVHGRVATKPDRDDLKAEIDERIRANADDTDDLPLTSD